MRLLARRRERRRDRRDRRGFGRHSDQSMAEPVERPQRNGPVALRGRHANLHEESRLHIVREFTGWGGLGTYCAHAAAHPVLDLRITCPVLFRADADPALALTQPFPRVGDPR